jgi:hypothetical protein
MGDAADRVRGEVLRMTRVIDPVPAPDFMNLRKKIPCASASAGKGATGSARERLRTIPIRKP